ncbi:MAG: hypothetical protein R2861_07090 [Desulfobacterales bacterium]
MTENKDTKNGKNGDINGAHKTPVVESRGSDMAVLDAHRGENHVIVLQEFPDP